MSIRANPTAIGLFMIGGIILAVTGVATLASASWFEKQTIFISYFGESVNGLEVGAPVKFQGVPVGRVTNLHIQIELKDKTFQVPVQYEIDLTRLTSVAGTFVQLDDERVLRQQIKDGLRAQLQMESMVTGQLYIELAYRPTAAAPELERRPTPYPEIPTSPSLLAAFGTQAGSMVGDVLKILFRVNEMLEEVNMEELNRSVVASAGAVERLAESPGLQTALADAPQMTAQLTRTMAEMESLAARLGATVDPLQLQLAGTNSEMVLTLQAVRQTMEETRGLISQDSGVGYQMEEAMASMAAAAEALRALAVTLERNPDMLIRGKRPSEN
ncbi:MAG TPA: MlaD family protein [Longimicrobiaceae bacterium]|nr:MlaD family protein [Longimicrobiaceae bacterium]